MSNKRSFFKSSYSWKPIKLIKESSILKNSNDIYKNELNHMIRVILYL